MRFTFTSRRRGRSLRRQRARAAVAIFAALSLASCGPEKILGKWCLNPHVVLIFGPNGKCHRVIAGVPHPSPFYCSWEARSDGDYDLSMGDDATISPTIAHIDGGELMIAFPDHSKSIVFHKLAE